MQGLDPRTLVLALFLTHLMATFCLCFVWGIQKTYEGFGFWVLAMGAQTMGGLLMAERGVIPDFLSIIAGNTLMFVGLGLMLQAGTVLLDRGRVGAYVWWTLIPVVISFILFTLVWPNFQARIVIGGFYGGALLLALAKELILDPQPTVSQSSRFTGGFVLAMGTLTLLRAGSGFFGSPSVNYFDSVNFIVLNGLLGVMIIVGITFGIFMMNQQRLEADLVKAEEEAKVLRGFIPICSACKKIREDDGFWTQLEDYFRKHAEAEFTHGICPECQARLYPDL